MTTDRYIITLEMTLEITPASIARSLLNRLDRMIAQEDKSIELLKEAVQLTDESSVAMEKFNSTLKDTPNILQTKNDGSDTSQ